jgi:sugar phosphate isomerase/epimerase
MRKEVDQVISISTAAFDGHELSVALHEISQLGPGHVELAFIQGYMDPFGEEIFSPSNAKKVSRLLSETNLACFAVSAHMDLATELSPEIFKKRMDFANRVGARIIISNAGPKQNEQIFIRNMEALVRFAESLDLIIGIENPGDGKENIIQTGRSGASLIKRIGSPWVKLNYDFGNLLSHLFERVRPEEDYKYALPYSAHLHLKDVRSYEQGWLFTEIGKGSIDYRSILKSLKSENQSLPLSLEVPLRLTRVLDASPRRQASPVPLDEIRRVLQGSINFINHHLGREKSKGSNLHESNLWKG